MARKLISDYTKQKYKKNIQKFINDLSQTVFVYTLSSKAQCTNCHFDSVNNKSTGKCKWTPVEAAQKQAALVAEGISEVRYKYFLNGRCPVCTGIGFIQAIRKRAIKGIIHWATDDETKENGIIQTPAGLEGATIVLVKTDPIHKELFAKCDKIKIQGTECKLMKPPFIRGVGNLSVLIVAAYTIDSLPREDKPTIKKPYYE